MKTICRMLKRDSRGFTLVELMVVLLIIGILVAIAIPIYNSTQKKAKERACEANIRTIEGAAAQYYSSEGKWPTSMNDLVGGYLKEEPTCPFTNAEGSYTIGANGQVTCSQEHDNPSQGNPSQGNPSQGSGN